MLNCRYYKQPVEFFLDDFRHDRTLLSNRDFKECMKGKNTKILPCAQHLRKVATCQQPSETCYRVIERHRQCVSPTRERCEVLSNDTQRDTLHDSFRHHRMCLTAKWTNGVLPCIPAMERACTQSPLRAVKVIRLTMDAIGSLLSADPHIKLIHLLRDPRGMIMSQRATFPNRTSQPLKNQAYELCLTMLRDVTIRKQLEVIHPQCFPSAEIRRSGHGATETTRSNL